jgi:hypothetical protein
MRFLVAKGGGPIRRGPALGRAGLRAVGGFFTSLVGLIVVWKRGLSRKGSDSVEPHLKADAPAARSLPRLKRSPGEQRLNFPRFRPRRTFESERLADEAMERLREWTTTDAP